MERYFGKKEGQIKEEEWSGFKEIFDSKADYITKEEFSFGLKRILNS